MELEKDHGCVVRMFSVDSKDLPDNIFGKFKALHNGIYARKTVRNFANTLAEFRPDVVHVHELLPLLSGWILQKCTKLGIPTVMLVSAYRLTCPVATHFRNGKICTRCLGGREYWCILKNCRDNLPESIAVAVHNVVMRGFGMYAEHVTRLIAPSDFSARWLIEKAGIPKDRVVTLNPLIDLPDAPADADEGEYVAYAGRFAPEKGVDTLLEATRLTGLPVRLAGDSATLYAGRENVRMIITQNSTELAQFYRGSRILVVPSIWNEVFGMVAAEAMAHGVPVVVAQVGGLADLVDDGVTGLLFEPGNATDLADKLKRLWHDRRLCRRLGVAGREKIFRLCAKDIYFKRLMSIYEESRAAVGASAKRTEPRPVATGEPRGSESEA